MKSVQVFLGADLRSMHAGLKKLAASYGVHLDSLGKEEAVVFINSAKNKIKSYSYNGAICYIRFDDPKRPIDLNALDELPKAFNKHGTLNYTKALKAALIKQMKQNKKFKEMVVLG